MIITDTKFIKELIDIQPNQITKSYMMDLFGTFGNSEPKYRPEDIISFPPNSYMNNKNTFTTTLGLFLFNKRSILGNGLFNVLGYINYTIDNGVMSGDILEKISYALIDDEITVKQHNRFLDDVSLYMRLISVISYNHSMRMLKTSSHLRSKRNKLLKQNEEALKNGDIVAANKIEKELLADAKEYLSDDRCMDMYNSKSRSKFDAVFKNTYVMRGGIARPDGSGFDIATSNFSDGIKPEEFTMFANSLVNGIYDKAKNTAVDGYKTKLIIYACGDIVADKEGSDCGTKNHIKVKLTDENIKKYMYNYMIEGSKLVRLDPKNKDKYIGKEIKLRFSSMCEGDKICNKCLGDLYYKLGIENVGMLTVKVPNELSQKSMKKFHVSTISINEFDPGEEFY